VILPVLAHGVAERDPLVETGGGGGRGQMGRVGRGNGLGKATVPA
jgi:hypothetical protein